MVVAERRLIVTGPSGDTEVSVRLFQPENEEGMWICRYEIDWPNERRSYFAGGVDSFQALILALQMIGAEIDASAYHKAGSLKWFERYRGYGFPGSHFAKSLSLQKMGLTGLISVLPATSTIIGPNSVAARLS